jgi:ABC-type transport system involved in multi-copper enzyme maturation permease subunit
MIWTSWRQQRSLIVAMAVVAAVFMAYLVFTGFHVQRLWIQFLAKPCRGDFNTPVQYQNYCALLLQKVVNTGQFNRVTEIVGLTLGPLFGSILGVSAVAREVERGTTRLAWTQSFSRSKWLLSKYTVNIGILSTIFVPMCFVLAWWIEAAHYSARIAPSGFPIAGFLPLLYSIVAFTLVVTVGLFVRRAGWTLAVGLVLAGLVIVTVEMQVRPLLVSPQFVVVSTLQVAQGSTSGFYTSGGPPSNSWGRGTGFVPIGTKKSPSTATLTYFTNKMHRCEGSQKGRAKNGYQYCLKYTGLEYIGLFVPNSDFWNLQFLEGSIYFGFALLLTVVSIVRVRRMLA